MVDSHFVHTNRHKEPDVDLERLFEDVGAIATFSDRDQWGSQLRSLKEGDRVFAYDKIAKQVIGVGIVEETWNEEGVTNAENKIAPDSDSEEFQVQVDWAQWYNPGDGYDLDSIRRIFDYGKRYSVPSAVSSISNPSEETIEQTYSAIESGESLEPSTPDGGALEPDSAQRNGTNTTRHNDQRSLFVQRGSDGPFRQNLGTSLTTPLSEDIRVELQHLIDESGVENNRIDQLYRMLDEGNVTAWGARQGHETVRAMSPGDSILYLDAKSKRNIRYHQQIELVLPEPADDSDLLGLQKEMAELLWRDENFTSLWFSSKDLTYFDNPSDQHGYEAFNVINTDVDPEFSYYGTWFTRNVSGGSLVEVDSDYLEHYDGVVGYIRALCDSSHVERTDEPVPNHLVINSEILRERDFPPVVHEFDDYDADPDEQSPDSRVKYAGRFDQSQPTQAELLEETDVHGHALIRDGDEIIASATIGCWFRKKVDETFDVGQSGKGYSIVSLVDYREFPTPVEMSHRLLEFETESGLDPRSSDVAKISPDPRTAPKSFEIARELSVSPDYHQRLPRFISNENQQPDVYLTAAIHLVSGKNAIFYGPPGTGKTRAATRLTEQGLTIGYDLSTAHAELANYDIVGGYAPGNVSEDTDDNGGNETTVDWQSNPGIVTEAVQSCERKLGTNGHHHWLVFDELNRTNPDQAFGDIFTLLDLDYRTEQSIEYADQSASVPLSFRILGTMNTEDQAKLFSLGGAFRRRFGFVPVPSLLSTVEVQTDGSDRDPDTNQPLPKNADELREEVVEPAVREDLTRKQILVDQPRPVLHHRDAATIDSALSSEAYIEEAYGNVTSNSAYGYTSDIDGLDVVMKLAAFLEAEGMVTLGHTHLIDIAKFLTAADLLDPNGVNRRWLDEAVIAFLLPQLDSFFTRLEEEQAIGGTRGDAERSNGQKLQQFLDLVEEFGLTRTHAMIDERDRGVGTV